MAFGSGGDFLVDKAAGIANMGQGLLIGFGAEIFIACAVWVVGSLPRWQGPV